jgi:4-hydroxybenzoate polyprenyltransferase
MEWMQSNMSQVKGIMLIGIAGSIWMALYLELLSFFILSLMALISFLYAFKINVFSRRTNLRDIPGIKIYLIGIVWSVSCATLPFIENGQQEALIPFITVGYFLYILGITIPFDIRDVELDEHEKRTIPQIFGVRNAKIIAIVLLIASYCFLSFPHFNDLKLMFGILLSVVLVLAVNKKRDELYYSFVLDGLLIFVPLSYYLLHNLYPTDI